MWRHLSIAAHAVAAVAMTTEAHGVDIANVRLPRRHAFMSSCV